MNDSFDCAHPESQFQSAAAPKRILIVDDNEDSAETMALLFRLNGHEVTTVSEGTAALSAARTLAPDLVLLDIGLPGMNGYEVGRGLRERGCAARLVAITGYDRPDDRKRSSDAGFDDHLVKPVDLQTLEHLVDW
ncbi:MAG TPA: response regulator [Steroidobacteraceae bacterium]|nr:response regulator [Steroidobacteraceae bacterium]